MALLPWQSVMILGDLLYRSGWVSSSPSSLMFRLVVMNLARRSLLSEVALWPRHRWIQKDEVEQSRSNPAASIHSNSRRGAPLFIMCMDHPAVVMTAEFKVALALIWAKICRIVSNRRADGEPGTSAATNSSLARAVSWAASS
jgi:hypothetical protein